MGDLTSNTMQKFIHLIVYKTLHDQISHTSLEGPYTFHASLQASISRSGGAQDSPSDRDNFYDEDVLDFDSVSSREREEEDSLSTQTVHLSMISLQDLPMNSQSMTFLKSKLVPLLIFHHRPSTFKTSLMNMAADLSPKANPPLTTISARIDLFVDFSIFSIMASIVGYSSCLLNSFEATPLMHPKQTTSERLSCFNEYVNPGDWLNWDNEVCVNSHGLPALSECIKSAQMLVSVWTNFCTRIKRHVRINEKVILCMYQGETYNMHRIWNNTKIPDPNSLFLHKYYTSWNLLRSSITSSPAHTIHWRANCIAWSSVVFGSLSPRGTWMEPMMSP